MAAPTPDTPHLLVAEADAELQHVFQHVLAEAGYACTVVSSLEEALRLLGQQPFDLVLTDAFIHSSQWSLAVLRPLLAVAHPRPVVLCTAWPLTEAEVQREGFAALVRQPFDLEHLVTTVAACLQHPPYPGQPPLVETAP